MSLGMQRTNEKDQRFSDAEVRSGQWPWEDFRLSAEGINPTGLVA
jgi:hypothetical protein